MLCCAVKVLEKRSVSAVQSITTSAPLLFSRVHRYIIATLHLKPYNLSFSNVLNSLTLVSFFFCSSYSSDVKLLSRPGHLENRTKLRSLKKPFRREAKSLQLTKTSSVDLSLTFKNCMTPSIETRPCNCEPSVISSGRNFTATRDFVGIRSCD